LRKQINLVKARLSYTFFRGQDEILHTRTQTQKGSKVSWERKSDKVMDIVSERKRQKDLTKILIQSLRELYDDYDDLLYVLSRLYSTKYPEDREREVRECNFFLDVAEKNIEFIERSIHIMVRKFNIHVKNNPAITPENMKWD
jgi:hypothetical protein